ncbi:MAG: acetyl-CoA carboxylase biotin carboxylase subunit [Calditrichaeota bacterium]|nr:MAG: acetyl-CoA carboxylase biotin carboxylase subunit [Calditrichota bacterium]
MAEKKQPIQKLLIANRGEIAVRVIRACRELGIVPVAVYSEVDRFSRHVLEAAEAVALGGAAPAESYLNIERIVEAARRTGCQAIHPGYGFLAENPDFARACREAGLLFIGPPPESMALVGDKLKARHTVQQAGVPLVPGREVQDADPARLQEIAEEIGFPVLIKAAAGGGGKGMRVVRQAGELASAVAAARREARAAFGNDTVYLEKYIEKPRHVEIQVLADAHGNVVHLFERECSVQRRHQKIVEESPSPALDPQLRQQMGETACRVMQSVGYINAGTVEFLLDEQKNFYFLEVNARIQVEHPVTEMVTGVDLVHQQIAIAQGASLPFRQEQVRQYGHAIECRIYAEDPANNFFPSVGKLLLVREPSGPGIRCDSGIYSGWEVTHHYDPILSKLITWDVDRQGALARMKSALANYVLLGIENPVSFLQALIEHPAFQAGNLHTHFLEEHFSDWQPPVPEEQLPLGMLAAALQERQMRRQVKTGEPAVPTPWQALGRWEMLHRDERSGEN